MAYYNLLKHPVVKQRHLINGENENVRAWQCIKCNEKFKSLKALKQHKEKRHSY